MLTKSLLCMKGTPWVSETDSRLFFHHLCQSQISTEEIRAEGGKRGCVFIAASVFQSSTFISPFSNKRISFLSFFPSYASSSSAARPFVTTRVCLNCILENWISLSGFFYLVKSGLPQKPPENDLTDISTSIHHNKLRYTVTVGFLSNAVTSAIQVVISASISAFLTQFPLCVSSLHSPHPVHQPGEVIAASECIELFW